MGRNRLQTHGTAGRRQMAKTKVIYGAHPVRSALEAGRSIRVLYATREALAQLPKPLVSGRDLVVVERRFLDRLCNGANHQGMAAVAEPYRYLNISGLEDLVLAKINSPERTVVLALDRVEDPRNLGAIVRSAHELEACALVIPERHAASMTPAAIKVSAGAAEHVPVARVGNLSRALEVLSSLGLRVYGAAGGEGRPPEDLDLADDVVLVLGAEGRGIRPGVAARCDDLVRIPISGTVGSLNVSVAAGILLAESARQWRASRRSSSF